MTWSLKKTLWKPQKLLQLTSESSSAVASNFNILTKSNSICNSMEKNKILRNKLTKVQDFYNANYIKHCWKELKTCPKTDKLNIKMAIFSKWSIDWVHIKSQLLFVCTHTTWQADPARDPEQPKHSWEKLRTHTFKTSYKVATVIKTVWY